MSRSPAPSVAVIIPLYYGRDLVGEALRSVREQDYGGPVSVLAIEDGTPEPYRSEQIVREYGADYLRQESNCGVFATRLAGAGRFPHADYLAFLDQDDQWAPAFLRRLVQELEIRGSADFAVANAWVLAGGSQQTLYGSRRPSLLLEDLKVANQIVSPSQALIRQSAWAHLNLVADLPWPGADDWVLWLALTAHGGRGSYVEEPLVTWRDHPAGSHHARETMRKSEEYVVRQWFPRMGLTAGDQRLYHGRATLDALWSAWRTRSWRDGLSAGWAAAHHPGAFWRAVRFRWRHRREGII